MTFKVFEGLRARIINWAFIRAKARVEALPRPEEAPVTTMVLPERSLKWGDTMNGFVWKGIRVRGQESLISASSLILSYNIIYYKMKKGKCAIFMMEFELQGK